MDTMQLRLELLKLTYSHAREPDEAVRRAEVLERFASGSVLKETPETVQPSRRRTRTTLVDDPFA